MSAIDQATRFLAGPMWRRLFKRLTVDRATVFFFHRIERPQHGIRGHTLAFIAQAIALLRQSGATLVSLRDVIEAHSGNRQTDGSWIAFTMDDGFADQYEVARTVFVRQRCPVTIFPITGFLDRELWPWDDQLTYIFKHAKCDHLDLQIGERTLTVSMRSSQRDGVFRATREWCKRVDNADLYRSLRVAADRAGCPLPSDAPPGFEPMTWSQARELETLGVDFGVHTVTHRILSRLDSVTAKWEMRTSWDRLRSELAAPLPVIAWPTGGVADFSERDERLAKEIGLHTAVSTRGDYALLNREDQMDRFTLSRFALPTTSDRLLHYGSWIERGKQLARRVCG